MAGGGENRYCEGSPTPHLVVIPGHRFRRDPASVDRLLLAIVVIIVTGMVSASVLLARRAPVRETGAWPAGGHGQNMLRSAREGSCFYILVGLAMLGSTALLVAARFRADDGQGRLGLAPGSRTNGHRRTRPRSVNPSVFRTAARQGRFWASSRTARVNALILALCLVILLLTFPAHESAFRRVFWAYAAAGTALGVWASVKEYRRAALTRATRLR
jgi:hypothetical protein